MGPVPLFFSMQAMWSLRAPAVRGAVAASLGCGRSIETAPRHSVRPLRAPLSRDAFAWYIDACTIVNKRTRAVSRYRKMPERARRKR